MSGKLVGHPLCVVGQDLTAIDGPSSVASSNGLGQRNPLGTRAFDDAGNEYIYLAGVASLVAGDWVSYNLLLQVALRVLVSSTQAGPVATAMGAFVAGTWGWYQIYGITAATANIATDASGAGKALYLGSVTGRLTTSATAAQMVFGAFAAANIAANAGQAFISYPFVMQNATV